MKKRLGISVVLSLVALAVLAVAASGAARKPNKREASLPLDPIGITLTNDYIGELQPRGVVETATRCQRGRKLTLILAGEPVAIAKSIQGGEYIFDPGVSAEELGELQTFTIELKPMTIGPKRDPKVLCLGATKRLVADGVFNSVTINLNAGTPGNFDGNVSASIFDCRVGRTWGLVYDGETVLASSVLGNDGSGHWGPVNANDSVGEWTVLVAASDVPLSWQNPSASTQTFQFCMAASADYSAEGED